ncbi:hypothetical protein THRCLA_12041 [Thraustotheca clavata]|uniref:Uncharacterized protein n=1 Tax=Thraustotheca clavata TaxID=74557 RepID=A0A1V9Y422_9STRA|nr:hypothetical protein THRCLA_12041 [Thraustotheca clavata]
MKSIFHRSKSAPTTSSCTFLTVINQPDLLPQITQYQAGSSQELAKAFKKYRKQLKKAEYAQVVGDDHTVMRCFVLFKLLFDGRSELVKRLLREYPNDYTCPLMPHASELYAIDAAARLGDLQVIQFLHERNLGECSPGAMDIAAAIGHYRIVQYLHRHRTEGCTQLAFLLSKRHGHMKIYKYLKANCSNFERRASTASTNSKDAMIAGGMVTGCTIQ